MAHDLTSSSLVPSVHGKKSFADDFFETLLRTASGDSHSSSAAAARAKVGPHAGHISRARNYGFMDRNLPCQFTLLPARDFAKPQARTATSRHES
jgi:hypothetical protein